MEETRTTRNSSQTANGKKKEGRKSDTMQIGFDFEKYAHFLDSADLTDDQKRELLATLWNILSEFVMLGFGVHPIQQVCGQHEVDNQGDDSGAPFLIQSDLKHLIEAFDDVVEAQAPATQEGVDA